MLLEFVIIQTYQLILAHYVFKKVRLSCSYADLAFLISIPQSSADDSLHKAAYIVCTTVCHAKNTYIFGCPFKSAEF